MSRRTDNKGRLGVTPAPGTDFDRKNWRIAHSSFWTRRGMFFNSRTFKRMFFALQTSETPRLGLKLQKKASSLFQAIPLHFCILQATKNWTVGRPGNEAKEWHQVEGGSYTHLTPTWHHSCDKMRPGFFLLFFSFCEWKQGRLENGGKYKLPIQVKDNKSESMPTLLLLLKLCFA